MKLSWRDIVTTLFAIAIGVALFAKVKEYNWTFIGTWRTAIGTVGVLGLLMATFDEEDFTHFNAWGALEWTLALAAVGLAIAGLIVVSKVLFVLLAADVLALWLASLGRHILSKETTMETTMRHGAAGV